MLTDAHLKAIMPLMPADRRSRFLPSINRTLQIYGIHTPRRAAAFLGQLAHESCEFRYMEELWGPTAQQKRYEPVTELSIRLGNVRAGDGHLFRGRGPIQITGRANYQRYGRLLQLDLVAQPDRVATPEVGLSVAGLYWSSQGLNALAELLDDREITRRINGGFNGLAERVAYSERARAVLARDFVMATTPRALARETAQRDRQSERTPYAVPLRIPRRPLMRGHAAEEQEVQVLEVGGMLREPVLP